MIRYLPTAVLALAMCHAVGADEDRAMPNTALRALPTQQTSGLLGRRLELWRQGRLWHMMEAEDDYLLAGFEKKPGRHT